MRRCVRKFTTFIFLLSVVFCTNDAFAKLPFVVKVVYFKPTDAPAAPQKIDMLMKDTQEFYKREMIRHGYAPKTFRLETDANGKVVVHTIKGKGKRWEYINNTSHKVIEETPNKFLNQNNIHVFIVGGVDVINNNNCGIGYAFFGGVCGGRVFIPGTGECLRLSVIAHELGHAFGLYHDNVNRKALMGIGDEELIDYECRWLDKHHYFNNIHAINGVPRVIRMHKLKAVKNKHALPLRPLGVAAENLDLVEFNVEVESPNSLHQFQLVKIEGTTVVGWSKLTGNRDIAKILVKRFLLIGSQVVYFQILDEKGNQWYQRQPIQLPSLKPVIAINKDIDNHENADTADADNDQQKQAQDLSVSPQSKRPTLWADLKRR